MVTEEETETPSKEDMRSDENGTSNEQDTYEDVESVPEDDEMTDAKIDAN